MGGDAKSNPLEMLFNGYNEYIILTYPNDTLTKRCQPVDIESKSTQEFGIIQKLEDILYDPITSSYKGVGLSAPQIGILERACIIRYGNVKLDLVNPEIVETSNRTIISNESCLSFPKQKYMVSRYTSVAIKADSIAGVLRIGDMQLARIIQHEIDHLDGKLINMKDLSNKNIKIGRNEQCPCGSGKKFKKCCLNKEMLDV
jgi:peptide deformylase